MLKGLFENEVIDSNSRGVKALSTLFKQLTKEELIQSISSSLIMLGVSNGLMHNFGEKRSKGFA
jgi:hypothetical protein